MERPLTKSSVARRQLSTAIELLFAGGDQVSAYSLAANAWEVIDAMCEKGGIDSTSNDAREYIPSDKDLKRDYVNSPYRNFFKHADRDPEAQLPPISTDHLEGLMFLAVEDYIRLHNRAPVQFQVFQAWYLAKNPEKLNAAAYGELIPRLRAVFPRIHLSQRPEQLKAGMRALHEASLDPGILEDVRTESAYD